MFLDEGAVGKMWEGLNHEGDVFRKMLPKAKIRKSSEGGGGGGGGEQPSPLFLINVCSTKGSECPGDLPAVSPRPVTVTPSPGNPFPPAGAGTGCCLCDTASSHLHSVGPVLGATHVAFNRKSSQSVAGERGTAGRSTRQGRIQHSDNNLSAKEFCIIRVLKAYSASSVLHPPPWERGY